MEKSELRRLCRSIIEKIPPEKFSEWGKAMFDAVSETEEWQRAKSVFVYSSMPNEADTSAFISGAFAAGKRLCVPKITADGIMKAVEIKSASELESGRFGISEPKSYCNEVSVQEIDLLIMPCLTADESGSRLGRGGGYYDRFCEKCRGKRFVLCPEALLLDSGKIEMRAWDVAADYVVSEQRIIKTL